MHGWEAFHSTYHSLMCRLQIAPPLGRGGGAKGENHQSCGGLTLAPWRMCCVNQVTATACLLACHQNRLATGSKTFLQSFAIFRSALNDLRCRVKFSRSWLASENRLEWWEMKNWSCSSTTWKRV